MSQIDTERGKMWVHDYRTNPQARPLVLIHGAGGTHQDWPIELRRHPQAQALALDLNGHGHSGGAGRSSVADYADDVHALLAALNVSHAVIAGHSMGGAIAQTLALGYPQTVAGLILVGTGPRLMVNEAIMNGIRTDTRATVEQIMKWSWPKDTDPQLINAGVQKMLQVPAEVIYGDFVACQNFDVREQLHTVTQPTLILGAAGDKMTPTKWQDELAVRIPHAHQQILPSGGHMFPLEHPQTVTQAIVEWFSTLSS